MKLDFGAISQNLCLKSDTLYWLQVNQSLFFFFTWSFVLSRHFFVCLYLYCHCRSNYQEGRGWWSHSSIYCPIHVCTSPKPGTGFPSTYVVVFFSNHLKRDVVVCFVDIGGFYFHHCLIFLSSLTCVVTVCTIWKFKMATSGGQSLHWNPMGNNIFIFFLRTAEQNLTKLGRDVSCEVLKSCPGLY